jgi:hypothetical protein
VLGLVGGAGAHPVAAVGLAVISVAIKGVVLAASIPARRADRARRIRDRDSLAFQAREEAMRILLAMQSAFDSGASNRGRHGTRLRELRAITDCALGTLVETGGLRQA